MKLKMVSHEGKQVLREDRQDIKQEANYQGLNGRKSYREIKEGRSQKFMQKNAVMKFINLYTQNICGLKQQTLISKLFCRSEFPHASQR